MSLQLSVHNSTAHSTSLATETAKELEAQRRRGGVMSTSPLVHVPSGKTSHNIWTRCALSPKSDREDLVQIRK